MQNRESLDSGDKKKEQSVSMFHQSSLYTASPPALQSAVAKISDQKISLPARRMLAPLDSSGIVRVDLTVAASALSKGRLLGKGAFGAVYAGIYDKKPVAIKELSPHLTAEAVKELKREAEIMFHLGLESEYVVRLKKVCLEPLHYSLVMELMPKGSLYELLHNGKDLPWTIRYQIALDAAWGLKDLHAYHILHRDLKSLNILLDDRLRAKLADFGLAKVKHETSSQSSVAKGTVLWMAPELFDDEPKMTVYSDMYSFGMVLWELASRMLPYAKAPNQHVAARWIEKGKKEEVPGDCPPEFKTIIESCWRTTPAERHTAEQVAERLVPLVEEKKPTGSPELELQQMQEKIKQLEQAHVQQLAAVAEEKRRKEEEMTQLQEKYQAELDALKKRGLETRPAPVIQQPPQATLITPAVPTTSPKLSQSPHILLASPKPEQKYQPAQKDIETLLLHVVRGEQDEAEALLKYDPVLALSYGTVTDKSERTFSPITGFQYAVWALDWHMWEMMLRQFNKSEHWVLAAEQYEELEKKGTAHGKAFSLQPLIDALQLCSDKYSGWTSEQCKQYWCQEVGRLQSQLPWHVVNEYCRPDRSFYPCPTFTEQGPLPRGKGREKEWLHWNEWEWGWHCREDTEINYTIGDKGIDWAWLRGDWQSALQRRYINRLVDNPCKYTYLAHIKIDRTALASLSKARAQQQEELGHKLKKMLASSDSLKRPTTKHPTALQVAELLQPLVLAGEQKKSSILPVASVHENLDEQEKKSLKVEMEQVKLPYAQLEVKEEKRSLTVQKKINFSYFNRRLLSNSKSTWKNPRTVRPYRPLLCLFLR